MELIKTPIDLPCRTCGAQASHGCTTKPKVEAQWVKVLSWFHAARWRDFTVARNEAAVMNDWNRQYGGVDGRA